MTELWYIDTASINELEYNSLTKLLSADIAEEVKRFSRFSDRKLKLCARLLINNFFEKDPGFSWELITESERGKPIYTGGDQFNISHSHEKSVVVFSNREVGVDVERVNEDTPIEIASYFHPEEQEILRKSNSDNGLFYKIWTRKEAFLKATGLGITGGIEQWNCLHDEVEFENDRWHIESVDLLDGYAMAICQKGVYEHVLCKEITKDQLELKLS